MKKKALITGVSGQDGSYLAELLVEKGYEVHGTTRTQNGKLLPHLKNILSQIKVHKVDFSKEDVVGLILNEEFDEVYHLAAMTFVPDAKNNSDELFKVNTGSLRIILETVDINRLKTKVFFASSSEVYAPHQNGIDENSIAEPQSLYGLSKLLGQNIIEYYQLKGVFCCYGILFNHESERRGERFVTQKIARSVAQIKMGTLDKLEIGNIEAKKDWGYAPDFVVAFHKMLQLKEPENFVLGTGEIYTVKDVLSWLFTEVGLDYKKYIKINSDFYREEPELSKFANSKKAKRILNWENELICKKMFIKMLENQMKI